jgi:hypothetical protein
MRVARTIAERRLRQATSLNASSRKGWRWPLKPDWVGAAEAGDGRVFSEASRSLRRKRAGDVPPPRGGLPRTLRLAKRNALNRNARRRNAGRNTLGRCQRQERGEEPNCQPGRHDIVPIKACVGVWAYLPPELLRLTIEGHGSPPGYLETNLPNQAQSTPNSFLRWLGGSICLELRHVTSKAHIPVVVRRSA